MFSVHLPKWLSTIHHDGSDLFVSNPYPKLGGTVGIRVRTALDAPIRRIFIRTTPDGEQAFTPMVASRDGDGAQGPTGALGPGVGHPALGSVDGHGGSSWWEAQLEVNQPEVHYRFLLEAEDGVWWLNAAGPTFYDPLDDRDFRLLADYSPPAWVQEAVFYQIFPDRYANGDPGNDPQPHEFEYRGVGPQTFPWGTLPPDGYPFPLVFYGGDLAGIVERLDYLDDLGVNALYLNPIFTAYSNHKYDVVDYEHVDPHFGGDNALAGLRHALEQRGMRYILDIVPNHCGYWHPWFQAAREDTSAPEAEFFTFKRHPDEYASWLGVWILPKLDYRSAELRRRIYDGDDAVFKRWLHPPFSADGWRVDVANMLGRQGASQLGLEIGAAVRRAVKNVRPDAYLLGENFFDATAQLQGNQWDAVMNYAGFTKPLWHWLRGYRQGAWGMRGEITSSQPWPTAALAAAWQSRLAAIPWVLALQQYNLLGSHDTPRIGTIVEGNEALHRLAAVLQFTFPGVPGVYYGDEVGLIDQPGLGSRACMLWDENRWNQRLHAFYKQLIDLRRSSPVLQRGGFQILAVEEDTIAYQRASRAGQVIAVAHRATAPRPAGALTVAPAGIRNGTRFVEVFSGDEAYVRGGALQLPRLSQGGTVWEAVPSGDRSPA